VIPTVLILAHGYDTGAISVAGWLARKLRPEAVRVICPEALSLALWSHRVDARGKASTRLVLPHAGSFATSQLAAVFNRIQYLPLPRFNRATPKDRDYASAELQAVMVSWLAELGDRAVHNVRRHPWLSPSLPLLHWARATAACGLPVAAHVVANSPRVGASPGNPPLTSVTDGQFANSRVARDRRNGLDNGVLMGTVLVAGEEAGGQLADRWGSNCIEAAKSLDFPLLEFRFALEDREMVLVAVDPLPTLIDPWATALAGRLLCTLAREASQ